MSLGALKKYVFFEFLNLAGRAYLLVRHSENVILGNRGFTSEEKNDGIVLVFNSKMNFLWDEYGITATLVFGTSPQKCFIPVDDVVAVYSPELGAQFVLSAKTGEPVETPVEKALPSEQDIQPKGTSVPGKVVKVDFTKKKKVKE